MASQNQGGSGKGQGRAGGGQPARAASARVTAGKAGTSGKAGVTRASAGRNGARPGAANGSKPAGAPGSARAAGAKAGDTARRNGATGGGNGTTATGAAVSAQDGRYGGLLRPLRPFAAMTKLQLATFILALYGLGASIYLTIAHYDTHVSLVCSDKGLVNCEEVTTSPESMIFHVIPVAVAGLAFYVFMVAINSPWAWRMKWPAVRWIRLGSLVAGMCFVIYLIYAELIDIGAICLWCTSVHVATFLIFALVVFNASFTWGTLDTGRRS